MPNNITAVPPRAAPRVDINPGSPNPSIASPVVADKAPAFVQKMNDILGPATTGPIANDAFKKSDVTQPKVMTNTNASQAAQNTDKLNDTCSKNDISKTSTVEVDGVKLSMPPKIKLADVKAGDIIFKVATEKAVLYIKQLWRDRNLKWIRLANIKISCQ